MEILHTVSLWTMGIGLSGVILILSHMKWEFLPSTGTAGDTVIYFILLALSSCLTILGCILWLAAWSAGVHE